METGFEWVAEMREMISGPAKTATASLRSMGVALHKASEDLRGHLFAQKKHHDESERLHKAEHGFVKEFTGSLVPEIALGELLAEGVKKIGESIGEMVKFSVEVAEFKENTVGAYEVLGVKGEEMFASIDKLSRNIHMPAERAHELAQDLLTRGMQEEDTIQATIAAIGAARRAGPAGSAEAIQGLIEKSLSLGTFTAKPKQLAKLGIDVQALYADIAKRTGQSTATIKDELKRGTIDANVGIAAIVDAVNTGKIGQVAQKKLTMGDVVTDLMNNVRSIFQDVDTGPLVQGFREFVGIFDTGAASGETFKDVVTTALNHVVKWAGLALDTFTQWFLDAEIGAMDLYISLYPILHVIGQMVEGVEELWADWNKFTGGAGSKVGDALDVASSLVDPMQGLGFDAGKAFGAGVQTGNAAALEIHSPSRVLMRQGKQAGEGFAMGAEETSWSPMGRLAPPELSPRAGGRGGSVTIDVGGIHVTSTASAEEIVPLIEAQITDVFERAALELGA